MEKRMLPSGRLKLEAREGMPFYVYMRTCKIVAVVLICMVPVVAYVRMQLHVLTNSSDTVSAWSSSARQSIISGFNHTREDPSDLQGRSASRRGNGKGAAAVVRYLKEWELPEVKDASHAEKVGERAYGEIPRRFVPMGTSSFLFVLFGAYRVAPNIFGVTGLGPKPLNMVGGNTDPGFRCSWIPAQDPKLKSTETEVDVRNSEIKIHGNATKYLLGWDLLFKDQQEYVGMVVYCKFESPVGVDGKGGQLKMIVDQGKLRNQTHLQNVEFIASIEQPGDYKDFKVNYEAPFKYEYVYCGSPIYGPVNAHRLREWIAYHMRLFGSSSHFFLYDAGGINDKVWRVLKPWVKLGRVSISNVRQQARYSTYLYNQFMLANDCLIRVKPLAKWAFFFDIDEYVHVMDGGHHEESLHTLMKEMFDKGQRGIILQLRQRPMSNIHCVQNNSISNDTRKSQWAIEKLVYRRNVTPYSGMWFTHWQDHKSVFQPKHVLATGVHTPHHLEKEARNSRTDNIEDSVSLMDKMHYYHYRGTTSAKGELCQEFVDPSNTTIAFDKTTFDFDDTMSSVAESARKFEYQTIGPMSVDND